MKQGTGEQGGYSCDMIKEMLFADMQKSVGEINISTHIDSRGTLKACEVEKETGLNFKRFFIIRDVVGGRRGGHAHKYTDQVIQCLNGQFTLKTILNGNSETFKLGSEANPIYLPRMTWVEMVDITADCIILVLSSDSYAIESSIRNYDEFVACETNA